MMMKDSDDVEVEKSVGILRWYVKKNDYYVFEVANTQYFLLYSTKKSN